MTSRRLAVLLGLALLIVIGPIVGPDSAQPASRYSLTAAFAEHGSVDLGPYRHSLGVDYSVYRGKLRSDKAPGQPLLAVPAYLVGRAFGAESAAHAREFGDLGLWWETLWTSVMPLIALIGLMFLFAERFAPRHAALTVALVIGLCTMMLPHAVNLYAHDLSALLGFGAWVAIEDAPMSARRAWLGGTLAGMALATEYECGIVLAVLTVYVLFRQRHRIGWFALGAAGPGALLAWYQWRAFGAPWRTPAAFYNIRSGYSVPGLHSLVSVLFGNRGVLLGAPIALIGLFGAVWLAVSGTGAARRHALVALGIAVPYLVLCAGWSGFPLLEYPGLRYLIPALPFFAVPLAALWTRVWRPIIGAALLGGALSIPIAFSFVLFGDAQRVFPELWRRIRAHEFLPTLWSMGFGRAGGAFYALSVIATASALVALVRRGRTTPAGSRHLVPVTRGGSQ